MSPVKFGLALVSRGEGDPATNPYPNHKLLLADAVKAEEVGLDSVWVPDHFYFERPFGIETMPDVWTLLTAIGMRTERVQLGTSVLAATFRHPALLAKMAGALQELTDGRVILGLGAGNQPHEHNAFDLPFEKRIGSFKEYVPILTALLRGETVSTEGRYFTMREATLRTYVPPVPVWIASGGAQMLELTARHAHGWNAPGVGWNVEAYTSKYDALVQACRAVGRDPKELQTSVLQFLSVAPDAATAKLIAEELAERNKMTVEELQKRTAIGTPDQIVDRIRPFLSLGIDHFFFSVQRTAHLSSHAEGIELLGREVVPLLRG
jgi:alkanesulfonate monooxygenase SsuD/methylene tetrahydromethanopterin reductase-like flavin-dependent oxidoreductase (luciferase family)